MGANRSTPAPWAAALLVLAAAAALLPSAAALSWPLCDAGGQVWVTERPQTEPVFPGANLWYFCDSGLNVLGVSIDPCIDNGTVCTPAVFDALCQAFGFDRSVPDYASTTNATLTEAVRSLTGEYCLRNGTYSATVPDNLGELPGQPCQKIKGLACIRTRETIITALDQANLAAFRPAPPTAEPAVPAGPTLQQPESTVPPEGQQAAAATTPSTTATSAQAPAGTTATPSSTSTPTTTTAAAAGPAGQAGRRLLKASRRL